MEGSIFLCGQCEMLVELNRCHDIQAALKASVIVEVEVALNHLHKLLPAGELASVVALPLENTPEALHRAIVQAVGHA